MSTWKQLPYILGKWIEQNETDYNAFKQVFHSQRSKYSNLRPVVSILEHIQTLLSCLFVIINNDIS